MNNKRFAKALKWGGLISFTAGGQALVQALSLISGFLVIHLLTPEQYALYTLAYAMLGTAAVLADGGICAGVTAVGARQWEDAKAMGVALATGMRLRNLFAAITLVMALPLLMYLLIRNGSGWLQAWLIAAALVPAFYASLTDDLLEVPVKLNQDIRALQTNQVLTNLLRIVALVLSLLLLPIASLAILANGIPRIWGNLRLRRVVRRFANEGEAPDPQVRSEILGIVWRTLPGAIYFAVSGQVSIWLVTIFGSTMAIAQVGALGRLSAVLTVFGAVFGTLVLPRFARLPADAGVLLSRFVWIALALLLVDTVMPLAAYLFPSQILLLLGKNYYGLDHELVLSILGGCASMSVGVFYGLSAGRGWIISPAFSIVTSVAVQVLLVIVLDLSTPAGVLRYALWNAVWGNVMYLGYFLWRVANVGRAGPAAQG